ncbi:DUF1292 domain-containing protein [Cohnella suwonensis]|uniref:DUF1292 domain-containing protein n=1 Tax=Cohnella suwonensis TaxID=696072 RepID=A0ABW0M312_9BACL
MTIRNNGSALREKFGDAVELLTEDGKTLEFRILAELAVGTGNYAVLQSDAMRKEDEFEVFKVVDNGDGDPQLETVEDDDEWELVAEAYDDMLFGSDDRP